MPEIWGRGGQSHRGEPEGQDDAEDRSGGMPREQVQA